MKGKAGKPKEKDKYYKLGNHTFTLPNYQFLLLKKLAQNQDTSMSGVIRSLIDEVWEKTNFEL